VEVLQRRLPRAGAAFSTHQHLLPLLPQNTNPVHSRSTSSSSPHAGGPLRPYHMWRLRLPWVSVPASSR
jgi:hypothetical protein